MKKLSALLLCLALLFLCCSCGMFSDQSFFDGWVSETNEEILHIIGDSFADGSDAEWEKHIDGRIEEIYCVQNDRIYLCYSTAIPDAYPDRTWHIASIGRNGEDFTEHYGGNLFTNSNPKGYAYEYTRLSITPYDAENYGGFYAYHKIYLHGDKTTVVYDIQNGTLSETDGYPVSPYTWSINEHKTIVIQDREQNVTKTLTLESMAEENPYAKDLLAYSKKNTWNGTSLTENIFSGMKIVGDRIYVICEMRNWHGESFAVVFRYDFASDSMLYVSHQKTSDRVESIYSFAMAEN